MNPLGKIIDTIITQGESRTREANIEIIFQVGGETIYANSVIDYSVERNYNMNYYDLIITECLVPLGTFAKRILPHMNDMIVLVIETRGFIVTTNKYYGHLLNRDIGANHPKFKSTDENTLNKEMAYLKIQLSDVHMENMMYVPISGTLGSHTIMQRVVGLLSPEWIKQPSYKYTKFLSMIDVKDNSKTQGSHDKIIIPDGLSVLDAPIYLQKKSRGIYKGGMGLYSHTYVNPGSADGALKVYQTLRGLWVYPLYDIDETLRNKKKLIIVRSNRTELKEIERSYYIDDTDCVFIIDSSLEDLPFLNAVNQIDNGEFIYNSPASVSVRSHLYNEGKVYIPGGNHKSTINETSINRPKRKTIINNTENSIEVYTESIYSTGEMVRVEWKSSVPDILFPGMLVEFYYEEKDDKKDSFELKKFFGVLQGMNTRVDVSSRKSVSILHIWLDLGK